MSTTTEATLQAAYKAGVDAHRACARSGGNPEGMFLAGVANWEGGAAAEYEAGWSDAAEAADESWA